MKRLICLLLITLSVFGASLVHAADTAISGLPAVTSVTSGQEYPLNDGGTTRKATAAQLKTFIDLPLVNASTAAQAPGAGASTYLTNSNISVPVGKLKIGTVFRWTLAFSKTAAGTAARAHIVRIGTAGTTSDAAIITLTSGTPSAAVDQGYQTITVIIRGPLSASCIAQGTSMGVHQLSTTGLFANETEVLLVTSSTWDCTTANLIVGLSVTTGASEALTYESILAEAFNL